MNGMSEVNKYQPTFRGSREARNAIRNKYIYEHRMKNTTECMTWHVCNVAIDAFDCIYNIGCWWSFIVTH